MESADKDGSMGRDRGLSFAIPQSKFNESEFPMRGPYSSPYKTKMEVRMHKPHSSPYNAITAQVLRQHDSDQVRLQHIQRSHTEGLDDSLDGLGIELPSRFHAKFSQDQVGMTPMERFQSSAAYSCQQCNNSQPYYVPLTNDNSEGQTLSHFLQDHIEPLVSGASGEEPHDTFIADQHGPTSTERYTGNADANSDEYPQNNSQGLGFYIPQQGCHPPNSRVGYDNIGWLPLKRYPQQDKNGFFVITPAEYWADVSMTEASVNKRSSNQLDNALTGIGTQFHPSEYLEYSNALYIPDEDDAAVQN